jgi:hypothetical protein
VLAAPAILSLYTSISGLFKAELFPQHIRALGVGVALSISIAGLRRLGRGHRAACKQVGL